MPGLSALYTVRVVGFEYDLRGKRAASKERRPGVYNNLTEQMPTARKKTCRHCAFCQSNGKFQAARCRITGAPVGPNQNGCNKWKEKQRKQLPAPYIAATKKF